MPLTYSYIAISRNELASSHIAQRLMVVCNKKGIFFNQSLFRRLKPVFINFYSSSSQNAQRITLEFGSLLSLRF